MQLHFTKDYKCVYNLWFHYVKQVHCCIWNYVRKEWHFAVDDVWSNLQGSFTDVQVNNFGIYSSGGSVFKPSHPYNSSAIQQNKSFLPLPSSFFFFFFFFFFLFVCFVFLSFLRVWLLGKHFRMVSEQRRFFQLLHWPAFSYREKATCNVVASHCMTKHDLMKFSQRSLLLLLLGLLLCPRLWLQTVYQSRTKFCSAQVKREIIEAPVSPCFIQREHLWLFVLPV